MTVLVSDVVGSYLDRCMLAGVWFSILAGTQDLMSGISEGDIARWDVNVLEYEYIDKY